VTKIIVHRLLALVPTLLLASLGTFLLLQLVPGDPALAIAGESANAEQLAEIRDRLGLDEPILVQYGEWLTDVLHGDLGDSFTTNEPVTSAIGRTLPTTLHLVIGGLVVALLLGVPAGVISARRPNSPTDTLVTSAASAGVAIPSFWLGLILVSLFAVRLGWFPATGFVGITSDPWASIRHLVLPSIALGLVGASEIARQSRAAMIEVLASDHVRTLRAKGLSRRRIVWRHGLKGSAVPLLTIVGLQVSRFLGATVVIETVFGISGLGALVIRATQARDFPVVQGIVLVMAVIVILTNFVTDVSYRLVDPRIR
jgi:peptide/nickel transport system permease protein